MEINFKDISYVFITGCYDGPTAGLCEYNGKKYYFDCYDFDLGGVDYASPEEMSILSNLTKNKTTEELEKFSYTFEDGTSVYWYDKEEKLFEVYRPRKFYLYKITPWQLLKLKFRQKLFNILVCDNGNYKGHTRIPYTYMRSNFLKNIYYKLIYSPPLKSPYLNNKIIGWFKTW